MPLCYNEEKKKMGCNRMDMSYILGKTDEKPLDRLVEDGGFCGILRKIACVGDSLSSGEFESFDAEGKKVYLDYYDYSWGQYLARMAGLSVYNFSRGGMSAKWFTETWGEENGCWDKEKAANAYILALGVNDMNDKSLEMGSVADVCLEDYHQNKPTFAGYYAKIIQRYKEIQPEAKFFLMTIPRGGEGDSKAELKEAFSQLIRDIAGLFENTYLLDFRKYAPAYDEEFMQAFYLEGHLNAAGYLLTARMVASYIDYIIRHDQAAFKQVGLMGTPYFRKL